jgi:hypothetical protein
MKITMKPLSFCPGWLANFYLLKKGYRVLTNPCLPFGRTGISIRSATGDSVSLVQGLNRTVGVTFNEGLSDEQMAIVKDLQSVGAIYEVTN